MERFYISKKFRTGLGLASNTYKQILNSGEMSLRELIAWAAGRGFSWVEVRDPEVRMTRGELLDLKEFARKLDLRLHYAWDNQDTLGEDERFYQGMENAAIFGEGTCCRVLIAPNTVKGKKGYTAKEMDTILPVLRAYVKKAKEMGICLCFENAMEPLFGDGAAWFGMNELLERCPEMCVTFDAANAMHRATRVNPSEEELLRYYQKFSDRIFYFHLKVTKDHELLDAVEAEGDFRVEKLFEAFGQNPDMKICLEIPQQPDLVRMTAAVERSMEVLEHLQIHQERDEQE